MRYDIVEVTFAQHLGGRLRERRNNLGETLDHVCAATGISKGFLSDIENGKRCLGVAKLCSLAKHLGKPLDWFVKGWDV